MDRPMCCPVVKGACAYAGVIFFPFFVSFPIFFSRLDSVGHVRLAHETHPLFAQFCSTNDSVGWSPVDHRLFVPRQRPQQQHSVLLQHFLSSKYENVSTSSVTSVVALNATAASALILGSTSAHLKVYVAATVSQKMSTVWAFTKLHRRFRLRDNPGQERRADSVAGMARSTVCTPTTVPWLSSDICTRHPNNILHLILFFQCDVGT